MQLKPGDSDFCMLCTFILKITNEMETSKTNQTDVRLQMVIQQFTGLTGEDNKWASKIELTAQRPQPLKMERHQISTLYFPQDQDLESIEIEILLGDATIKMMYPNGTVAMEYPCPMNSSHHLSRENMVEFNLIKVIHDYSIASFDESVPRTTQYLSV